MTKNCWTFVKLVSRYVLSSFQIFKDIINLTNPTRASDELLHVQSVCCIPTWSGGLVFNRITLGAFRCVLSLTYVVVDYVITYRYCFKSMYTLLRVYSYKRVKIPSKSCCVFLFCPKKYSAAMSQAWFRVWIVFMDAFSAEASNYVLEPSLPQPNSYCWQVTSPSHSKVCSRACLSHCFPTVDVRYATVLSNLSRRTAYQTHRLTMLFSKITSECKRHKPNRNAVFTITWIVIAS